MKNTCFFMPAQSGLLRMIRYDNTDNFSGITGVSNDLSGGSLSLVRDNIPDGPIWLQVSNDGTNLYWSMSVDAGEHFETMYSEANSSYFGGNPDQIVIAVTSGQSVGVISRTKYVHYN